MNRYERDFNRSGAGRQDYDRQMRNSGGGQYGGDFERGGRPARGYDRGYNAGGGRGVNEQRNQRGFHQGRAAPWYANPGRSMAEDFGDFSGRGRYGGYWGATDLRPMMANPDAAMRRQPRRNRND
jgi:hypothetical protein